MPIFIMQRRFESQYIKGGVALQKIGMPRYLGFASRRVVG